MTTIQYLELAAKVAPLGTATIALAAACIAMFAIAAQKDIAKRRAAIDFFLKTEMDKELVSLYQLFRKVAPTLTAIQLNSEFTKTKLYYELRTFLNICELIAVGVNEGAFSERVSFAYWGDVLPNAYRDTKSLIEYVRKMPGEGSSATYVELERLCTKWERKR
jgi:hypothetical protein